MNNKTFFLSDKKDDQKSKGNFVLQFAFVL